MVNLEIQYIIEFFLILFKETQILLFPIWGITMKHSKLGTKTADKKNCH